MCGPRRAGDGTDEGVEGSRYQAVEMTCCFNPRVGNPHLEDRDLEEAAVGEAYLEASEHVLVLRRPKDDVPPYVAFFTEASSYCSLAARPLR